MKKYSIGLIYILLAIQLNSCKKTNNEHPIPSFPFDFTINIELPSYSNLMGVGGWAFVNNTRNIIIYRKDISTFVAFDRQSPKDINAECPELLTPDTNNFLILIDNCNNAQFSLYDGQAIQNSEFGLRQYQTVWDGQNKLRIFN